MQTGKKTSPPRTNEMFSITVADVIWMLLQSEIDRLVNIRERRYEYEYQR